MAWQSAPVAHNQELFENPLDWIKRQSQTTQIAVGIALVTATYLLLSWGD
jgi:hypothetical protein